MNPGDKYICASCGEPQVATRTDKECWDEALDMYPATDLADGVETVCEDCYLWLTEQARLHAPHMLRDPQAPPP